MQLKYDTSIMKYFSIFENTTKVLAKDCFSANGTLIFSVEKGHAKIAVGKNGANIKKLSSMLNKEIKVIEFSKDIKELTKNAIFPLRVRSIEIEEGTINISLKSSRDRRILLDNNQKKLKLIEEILKRYDKNIKSVRILQM